MALLAQQQPYLNPSLDPKTRAADLTSRMTLEEKVSQMQNVAPAIPRLGIPAYDWWSEALHGAVGYPVTVFPQAIGLASTFDTPLVSTIGTAISDEGRARYYDAIAHGRHGMHQGLTFWAPNINIFRDPRWGRGQETYGEDPFLTSRMAVAYVKAMQDEHGGKLKAVATPKHYAVHSGPDRERHQFNAVVDPRDMWNTYLPGFKAAVKEADAWSIMSAYSAVNGVPDSANSLLLQQILRDRWGFKGYVVSDCGAIWDILGGHKYAPTAAAASADAVKAGCDLECGNAYAALPQAVKQGLIDEATIDKSVQRLFEARIRLGMFDPPAQDPYRRLTKAVIDSPAHRKLALQAARESVVLLKNDGTLPLKGARRIAVIGPNADDQGVPLGNYNGTPSKTVTVYGGLKELAPAGVEVRYAQGSGRTDALNAVPVPASALQGGVHGEFFLGENLSGKVVRTSDSDQLSFDWGQRSPGAGVPKDEFSARFTTTLVPSKTGDYLLGTRADDGARLKLDGKTIVEDWSTHAAHTTAAGVHLEAGHPYRVEVEYYQASGFASLSLVWAPPGKVEYSDAVDLANWSDLTVMVLGISGEIENEEQDRSDITLPSVQQALLQAVLATGKPVVVVLESGSCLAVDDKRIRGLVQAWYPGEEGGTAVAEVLYGKTNPSGRLPVTFYRSLAQVPEFRSYKMDGRTYRYFKGDPLYGFGYGLSYTTFAYGDLRVSRGQSASASLEAAVTVKNTGSQEGDEVVQMYAARQGASWPEPQRKLVAFQRIHLNPGEAKRVHLVATKEALGQADADGNIAIVPGEYTVTVGGGQPGLEPATSGRGRQTRVRM